MRGISKRFDVIPLIQDQREGLPIEMMLWYDHCLPRSSVCIPSTEIPSVDVCFINEDELRHQEGLNCSTERVSQILYTLLKSSMGDEGDRGLGLMAGNNLTNQWIKPNIVTKFVKDLHM